MSSKNKNVAFLSQPALINDAQPSAYDNVGLDTCQQKVPSVIPRKRQDVLKWYGWGYKNSEFYVENGVIAFKGEHYPLKGHTLPYFTSWANSTFNMCIKENKPFPELPKQFPQPTINTDFMRDLLAAGIEHSLEGEDRLIRSHGQTLHDIFTLWRNAFKRIPDVVVFPHSHKEVETIVSLAHTYDVMVAPYGGGTSVSGSITCPVKEERMICVLDTSQMNRMLWLNKENLTACFEAGIVGQDLERELHKKGLTVGHEPDSYEFSTLGGWVATRASGMAWYILHAKTLVHHTLFDFLGMKKNVYGNIEDLIVHIRMVTPTGVLQRDCAAPRVSCGPDFNHVIMGSEGTLGVITEVTLKVRPLPPVKRYGSLVFPDFTLGVEFMREVARRRCQPASVRLLDNEQFMFGQSLKPVKGVGGTFLDFFKRVYVTTIKRMDLGEVCAATLLFEGEHEEVRQQEALIYEIAKQFKGFAAGGQNGERGYILTFVIAYIRDFGLSQDIVAESFETSVPWDRCKSLCRNVKRRVEMECCNRKVHHFIISCRVTQTYDSGACVYFYFAFKYTGISDPIEIYEYIENCAREEILASGGSLSHHHGVGKIRSRWYQKAVSSTGSSLYLATKRQLDPKNIFALGNLVETFTQESGSEEPSVFLKSKL